MGTGSSVCKRAAIHAAAEARFSDPARALEKASPSHDGRPCYIGSRLPSHSWCNGEGTQALLLD